MTTKNQHRHEGMVEVTQLAMITQLFWVHRCPELFSTPLALAQKLLSEGMSSTSSSSSLEGDLKFEMASLPTALLLKHRGPRANIAPTWSCADDIEATCGSGVAAESALLCIPIQEEAALGAPPNHRIPPLSDGQELGGAARFVSVEWAPQETYWNSLDGSISGALLSHSSTKNAESILISIII